MKISIATPSYNCAAHIEQTIRSIHDQKTEADVQHVVMDGLSTDGTIDILKKHEDKLTWHSEEDKCPSDALNKAFALCDGDIVAWINGDDYYEPDTFEIVRKAFEENPDVMWIAGYYRMVDINGNEIRQMQARYKHFLLRHYSYSLQLAENVFAQPSVFMRREALKKVLPLDSTTENCSCYDYELWLKLGKLGKPLIIKQVLSNFRYLPTSITGSQTANLFKSELNYAKKEFKKHPIAVMIHHLNYLKIRLVYSWWKW